MRLDTAVPEPLGAKGIPHLPGAAGIWSSDAESGVLIYISFPWGPSLVPLSLQEQLQVPGQCLGVLGLAAVLELFAAPSAPSLGPGSEALCGGRAGGSPRRARHCRPTGFGSRWVMAELGSETREMEGKGNPGRPAAGSHPGSREEPAGSFSGAVSLNGSALLIRVP